MLELALECVKELRIINWAEKLTASGVVVEEYKSQI
jgi:hypothetical protein